MLVDDACPLPSAAGLLLRGPMLGPAPAPRAPLSVRGAFGLHRARLGGVAAAHRGERAGNVAVLVTELAGAAPQYTGALVYEEGALVRVFSGLRSNASGFTQAQASFELEHDRAGGFVQLQGRVLNAFVVGGGLPEGESLWQRLRSIRVDGGTTIAANELSPLADAWAIAPVTSYGPVGRRILVLARCGPAEPGRHVVSATEFIEGEVLQQQSRDGLVQIELHTEPRGAPIMAAAPAALH